MSYLSLHPTKTPTHKRTGPQPRFINLHPIQSSSLIQTPPYGSSYNVLLGFHSLPLLAHPLSFSPFVPHSYLMYSIMFPIPTAPKPPSISHTTPLLHRSVYANLTLLMLGTFSCMIHLLHVSYLSLFFLSRVRLTTNFFLSWWKEKKWVLFFFFLSFSEHWQLTSLCHVMTAEEDLS